MLRLNVEKCNHQYEIEFDMALIALFLFVVFLVVRSLHAQMDS